jgi:hypothetical protein
LLKPLTQWLHQKLNVLQQQEKQHAHEKEMQRQKLQQSKKLQQDVNVVHLQEKLRGEEQQEKLLVEEEQREDDADLFLFFFNLHLIRTVNNELSYNFFA